MTYVRVGGLFFCETCDRRGEKGGKIDHFECDIIYERPLTPANNIVYSQVLELCGTVTVLQSSQGYLEDQNFRRRAGVGKLRGGATLAQRMMNEKQYIE